MGLAVAATAWLALSSVSCQAGNRASRASSGFPSLLALEDPSSGRPDTEREVREPIRKMRISNRTWELHECIRDSSSWASIYHSTISNYTLRHRKPPSQTWPTSLENNVKRLVSVDFFVVPTVSF